VIERLLVGFLVSVLVSAAGWHVRALSGSGALAAVAVGTAIIGGTSWPGGVVLGLFFVSSSALSRLGRESGIAAKGIQRDWRQVIANGGVAALGGASGIWLDERVALALVAGALGAAAADTWATEIGSRSRTAPRLLLSRRVAEPGTSGGVTALGTAAALAGALALSVGLLVVAAVRFDGGSALALALVALPAAFLGSLVDSALGETLQERRYCQACQHATEALTHRCGSPTIHVGGVPGLDNDVVNLACTLTGGLLAGSAAFWFIAV
jgi:uncharacterized protein (TIGR00297 family)